MRVVQRHRTGHSAENLAILCPMALNLLHKESSKGVAAQETSPAAWSDAFLLKILAQV
jgi:hypothetical protein